MLWGFWQQQAARQHLVHIWAFLTPLESEGGKVELWLVAIDKASKKGAGLEPKALPFKPGHSYCAHAQKPFRFLPGSICCACDSSPFSCSRSSFLASVGSQKDCPLSIQKTGRALIASRLPGYLSRSNDIRLPFLLLHYSPHLACERVPVSYIENRHRSWIDSLTTFVRGKSLLLQLVAVLSIINGAVD